MALLPDIYITLPYSPIPLANASPKPVRIDGISSGSITLKNVFDGPAPNMYAASSYRPSSFSSTGCTFLTTNGIPTNTSAIIIPICV